MNAHALRRLFIPLAMAAIVGASVYALIGTSGAAASPQSPRPGVVGTVPVKFTVMNKENKVIHRGTGVATIVRLRSAAAKQAGATGPDAGAGPDPVCYAYYHLSYRVGKGGYVQEKITFSSGGPFVVGYGFNETTAAYLAETTEFESGDLVQLTTVNNSAYSETLAGYESVLYYC
jgi:hypothetical protein